MLSASLLLAASMSIGAPLVMDDADEPPTGWAVISPPWLDSGWRCANRARQEWAVSSGPGGTVNISSYEASTELHYDLPDGELVGTNRGEFGGHIEWVTRGGVRQMVVSHANPVAFTERGGDVYVASGLAHLGVDSGRIIRLHRATGGIWHASTVLDLGEAPSAAVRVDDTTWIMLTTDGVSRIDLSALTMSSIYRNSHWGMLYANSIRPLGKVWLIGARRAVIRLTPDWLGYGEDWLVPAQCERISGPSCECGK